MFIFLGFLTPIAAFGASLPFIALVAAILILVVWQIKKLNRIEEKLKVIQEKLNSK